MDNYKDKTAEAIEKIVKSPVLDGKLRKQDVIWIYRRYMYYLARALAHGIKIRVKMIHIKLHYITLAMPLSKQKRKIGIRSGVCPYFYFFVDYGGKFDELGYDYEPTKWMKKRIKEIIDSDLKLEIVPQ